MPKRNKNKYHLNYNRLRTKKRKPPNQTTTNVRFCQFSDRPLILAVKKEQRIKKSSETKTQEIRLVAEVN